MNLCLKPLTLDDRPPLERAITLTLEGGQSRLASWAFAPHFIWRDLFSYAWTELDGWWCIFAEYIDGIYMPLPPLGPCSPLGPVGSSPLSEVLAQVFAYMAMRNKGSAATRIENVPQELKDRMETMGYKVIPKDPDYLYRTQDLVNLKGDRYKSPRAAYNRFLRSHRVRYGPYQMTDRDACLALYYRWVTQKEESPVLVRGDTDELSRQMLRDAASAHRMALQHSQALNLVGRVAWVSGTIRGYTFGYERSPEVFCVLLEVADRTIYGLAQYLFREFCREARAYAFINTMDDSGLASLARSKRSYHPCQLVANYIAMP